MTRMCSGKNREEGGYKSENSFQREKQRNTYLKREGEHNIHFTQLRVFTRVTLEFR